MVHHDEIGVRSSRRNHLIDVTSDVAGVLETSGIADGVCIVSSRHTTAGVTINENADPDVVSDILMKLDKLVDQDPGFQHAEGNSDSHLKASMMGFSVHVPVRDSKLVLGTWQGIYFCEFDGPRSRRLTLTVIGDSR